MQGIWRSSKLDLFVATQHNEATSSAGFNFPFLRKTQNVWGTESFVK